MTTHVDGKTHKRWICAVGRVIAVVWSGFWALFGLLSALGERLDTLGVLFHMIVPGFVFLITVIIAWSYEKVGGIVLIVEGFVVGIAYPLLFSAMATSTVIFVLLTMALPPVLAGFLFMIDSRRHRSIATA